VLRFHAHYRQEYPTKGSQGNLFEQRVNYWELLDTPNVSDAENYLILDAEGAGHYVGCVLSVDNIDPLPVIRKLGSQEQVIKEYTWWGEGDDMIFIDGEPWPPLPARHRLRRLPLPCVGHAPQSVPVRGNLYP
jgi:hypothetical protein